MARSFTLPPQNHPVLPARSQPTLWQQLEPACQQRLAQQLAALIRQIQRARVAEIADPSHALEPEEGRADDVRQVQ
jgi:hypothetical protein